MLVKYRLEMDTLSTKSNCREREKRKNEIRDFISRSFNWAGQPMPTGEQVRERISELPEVRLPPTTTPAPSYLATHYTERVQSFFPTCNFVTHYNSTTRTLSRQLP